MAIEESQSEYVISMTIPVKACCQNRNGNFVSRSDVTLVGEKVSKAAAHFLVQRPQSVPKKIVKSLRTCILKGASDEIGVGRC